MAVQAQLYPENLGLPMCGLQQDWVVVNPDPAIDAAHDLCFTLHQDPHHHRPFGYFQQNAQNYIGSFDYNRGGASSSTSTCGSNIFSSMALSQSLCDQLELQRQEIDSILQIQSERLRSALQEQRKRELAILLKSMELKAINLMRQKEEDLAQATKRAMELEACLRKAEMESESWQRLARANETVVMDLSNTLEQVRERLVLVSNRADDAESYCCGSCDDHNREQEPLREAESEKKIAAACKLCNSRNSCVLFLPCRHLCSCKQCEAFLVSCPVCKSVKEASMEIFWF